MTREEAIGNLIHAIRWNDMPNKEALDMAIKALEQEPCEDAISRQAVIDTVESWLSCDDYNEAERHIMRAVQSVLYDSPPVNPQPKTGHWIRNTHNKIICSHCGKLHDVFDTERWFKEHKYCYSCGFAMVEPQESEVDK